MKGGGGREKWRNQHNAGLRVDKLSIVSTGVNFGIYFSQCVELFVPEEHVQRFSIRELQENSNSNDTHIENETKNKFFGLTDSV